MQESSFQKIEKYFFSFKPNIPDDSDIREEKLFANIDQHQANEALDVLTHSVPEVSSAAYFRDSSLE